MPTTIDRAALLDYVNENGGLAGLVEHARREQAYCCQHGCGSGACETCPCCSAGWCVMGFDGLPDVVAGLDPQVAEQAQAEALALWVEVAAEFNPVAALLADRRPDDARGAR